jgi:paraquat-inducible protein B
VRGRIQTEYAPLVRSDSVFWNAGGIEMHVGLIHGLDIRAESAKALLSGAIEMATPDKYGPAAANGTSYSLQEKPLPDWKKWNPDIALQLEPEASLSKAASERSVPVSTLLK